MEAEDGRSGRDVLTRANARRRDKGYVGSALVSERGEAAGDVKMVVRA